MTELIVKYNGDIKKVAQSIGARAEVLSANYAIITVDNDKISELERFTQIEYTEYPKLLRINEKKSASVQDSAIFESCIPAELTGKGVLIGLIDSGIEYRLDKFKDKIDYIWEQTAEGTAPEGFYEGSEYNREQIMNGNGGTGDTSGHGTHIAGIIADIASESRFVVVKLGNSNEFFARSTQIMRAVKYVIDKAVMLSKPIAINISYGTNDGSHNGNSLFETYLDDMCNIWKCSICVASGNEGESGHHYTCFLEEGKTAEAEFSVNVTECYLNIYKSFTDKVNIELISPDSVSTGVISDTSSYNFGDTHIKTVFSEPSPYNVNSEIFVRLENVKNGIWKIRLYAESITEGKVDIWLPSVESVTTSTAFLTPSADTTLTIPSTAERVITVGSYNSETGAFSPFSGRGYTAEGRVKPDITAPGENIKSISIFGGISVLSGTSVACPFVTASVALLMQWGIIDGNDIFLYGQRIKAYLRLGATRDMDMDYPNTKYGYGKLCLTKTLEKLGYGRKIKTMSEDINPIYSEDYIEFVTQKGNYTDRLLKQTEYINSCDLFDDYNIISIPLREYTRLTSSEEGRFLLMNEPFVLTQGDEISLKGGTIREALNLSGITKLQNQFNFNLKGNGVLVGIVDTGINYADSEFIFGDGTTKVISIWNQAVEGNDFCYGTIYGQEEINSALKSKNPYEIIEGDENGHGTAMARIITEIAPESEIIAVKLKKAKENLKRSRLITSDKAYSSADIMTAVEYISREAERLDRPVVIAVPFGTNEGGHDGSSNLERYLGDIAIKNERCICLGTGSEADKEHHIKLTFAGEEKETEIRVGDNENCFSLNIWAYSTDIFDISIISPIGDTIPTIRLTNDFYQKYNMSFSGTVTVQSFSSVYINSNRMMRVSFERPIPGIWRIKMNTDNAVIGIVHMWLPLTEFMRSEIVFLEPDPFYTATVPSTEDFVLSVGGYESSGIYISSGRGPNRNKIIKPYFTAPSDLGGFIGTGMAVAVSAGSAVLIFEQQIIQRKMLFNTESVGGFIIRGTDMDKNDIYPNNIWGFGKLDLYKAFQNN